MRYVKYDAIDFTYPEKHRQLYKIAYHLMFWLYKLLLLLKVKPEDARYVLPNAAATKIILTMNARELLHVFKLRTCNRAQWEIRDMAKDMLNLVYPTAPNIFKYAGPSCFTDGKCSEGELSCGKMHEVKEYFEALKKLYLKT